MQCLRQYIITYLTHHVLMNYSVSFRLLKFPTLHQHDGLWCDRYDKTYLPTAYSPRHHCPAYKGRGLMYSCTGMKSQCSHKFKAMSCVAVDTSLNDTATKLLHKGMHIERTRRRNDWFWGCAWHHSKWKSCIHLNQSNKKNEVRKLDAVMTT